MEGGGWCFRRRLSSTASQSKPFALRIHALLMQLIAAHRFASTPPSPPSPLPLTLPHPSSPILYSCTSKPHKNPFTKVLPFCPSHRGLCPARPAGVPSCRPSERPAPRWRCTPSTREPSTTLRVGAGLKGLFGGLAWRLTSQGGRECQPSTTGCAEF